MDARARLQRYLEQRRELGESELVLDTMSVDEVMALVGAKPASRTTGKARPERPSPPAPASAADHDVLAHAPESGSPPNTPSKQAPPSGQAPAAPPTRFHASAKTDWREALRDARPVSAGETKNAKPPEGSEPLPAEPAEATPTGHLVLPAWLESVGWPGGLAIHTAPNRSAVAEHANGITALPDLDAIATHIRACTRCALHTNARNAVPGEGNPQAELVCVGEGPGASEDEQGLPFVGESGQLLTKILAAIQLSREAVYICNVVKHRPPGNRDPLPDEVQACAPYLQRQLALVKPRVILALGRFAAQTLLGTSTPLGKLRERIHWYHGVPVVATYHPAALLRNEAWKRPAWEDVKVARRILDLSRAADGGATAGQHVD